MPHYEDTIEARLERIELMLVNLRDEFRTQRMETTMAQADIEAAIAEMQATVTRTEGVVDSTIAFIQQIVGLLNQNAGDPAAIRAIAQQLNSKVTELATAVETSPGVA